MKEENKKTAKKVALAGVGTAAGAAVGSVIENAVSSAAEEAVMASELNPEDIVAVEGAEIQEEANVVYAAAPVELDEVVVTAQAAAHQQPAHPSPARPAAAAFHVDDDDDAPIVAEVVAAPSAAPVAAAAPAADDDLYDDIVVVSESSHVNHDAFTVHANTVAQGPVFGNAQQTVTATVSSASDVPDYMSEDDLAMKADGIGADIAGIDAIDMPDYINNANIDSFTDMI